MNNSITWLLHWMINYLITELMNLSCRWQVNYWISSGRISSINCGPVEAGCWPSRAGPLLPTCIACITFRSTLYTHHLEHVLTTFDHMGMNQVVNCLINTRFNHVINSLVDTFTDSLIVARLRPVAGGNRAGPLQPTIMPSITFVNTWSHLITLGESSNH